ncbi:MAG: tetratricopeptide repeat protein [Sedimentisphaerales bacterium]
MSGKTILFLTALTGFFTINVNLCPADDSQQISRARDEVCRLLDADRFVEADSVVNKLVYDFKDSPDLPWAKYWIAERYERRGKFDDAKRLYQDVIQNHPDSPEAGKARLGIRRAEAMGLIASEQFDQAKNTIDRMTEDFAGNPDLPDTLYWIAERYERVSRFAEAKLGYERIVQNFPNSPMADKAKLGIVRAEVMALIAVKDFDKAREGVDKLTADFATSPDLPGALYWITERYVWVDRFDEAKPVCQRIVANYPSSSYADKAKLRVAIADVMAFINSQDYDGAQSAFDKVVSGFKDHQDLPLAAIIIGEKYYRQRKAADSVQRAKKAFQVITEKLPVNPRSPEACCWAGDCCTELGQYAEAITYYKRSCDGFSQYGCSPGSRFDNGFRTRSLYMLGQSYQKLSDANNISREQAEPLIIDSYERLVREFENCAVAKNGWRELGGIYAKNSRPQNTVRCYEAYLKLIPQERCPADVFYNLARAYDQTGNIDSAKKTYTKFLTSVLPTDPRRQEVKSRLSAMGNTD